MLRLSRKISAGLRNVNDFDNKEDGQDGYQTKLQGPHFSRQDVNSVIRALKSAGYTPAAWRRHHYLVHMVLITDFVQNHLLYRKPKLVF